jgi:hypothetical protein
MAAHENQLVDELRLACAWIAGRSTMVRVVEERIPDYAAQLTPLVEMPRADAPELAPAARERASAQWLTLDAINFGSGWFPTLRKGPQKTGYRTIAAGISRKFETEGGWSAAELTQLSPAELAGWLDQDPEHELIELMAQSLRALGANVQRLYGRSFAAVVDAAAGSATRLVDMLAGWRCFEDVSIYDGRRVPFLKRAQIAAADLDRARVTRFSDLDRLTMFADNLVPHVLRLDGVLWFDPELVARIGREELIEHNSPEEIEIRACAVHAVELLVAVTASDDIHPTAAQIDELLWNRGQRPEYKASPRHRSRCTAY